MAKQNKQLKPRVQATIDMPFPLNGIDERLGFTQQRPGSCVNAVNVCAFDPTNDRARGSTRPGTVEVFAGPALLEGVAIQNISLCVTTQPKAPTAVAVSAAVYALASGSGFGGVSSAGASIFTAGAVASFAFACSCWDDSGNMYVAQVNTTTGATKIYKYNGLGTAASGWTVLDTLTVSTGSLRKLAGMVIIGDFLYVATVKGTAPTNTITKINKNSGAIEVQDWYSVTDSATLVFSTGSINCLGKCGALMGIECVATGTAQCFKILDTTKTNYKAAAISTAHTGTAANARSRVVSDDSAFFYTISSTTTGKLKKYSVGGVRNTAFVATTLDALTVNSICYNKLFNMLVAVTSTSTSRKLINITTGAITSAANPGSVTAWHNVDTAGAGNFVYWRDANASNDIMGETATESGTFTTAWGPTTFANTTHSGSSINKGTVTAAPIGAAPAQYRPLVVSNGEVRRFSEDGAVAITGGACFNSGAKQIFSAQFGQDVYFADGTNYQYYKSSTDAMTTWATSVTAALPTDSASRKPRLIAKCWERCVLGGLIGDPMTLFMSRSAVPTDFDTAPSVVSPAIAFAINVGDFVNCIIAYHDDILIVGGDQTITQFTGDPGLGGNPDVISQNIGMAWGVPYVISPDMQLFFFSTSCEVYKMQPGTVPVCISNEINDRLKNVNLNTSTVTMEWDIRTRRLYVYITPHDDAVEGLHWMYEARTSAWFQIKFKKKGHEPSFGLLYDGPLVDDRQLLLGGRDGHIRAISPDAQDDCGRPIEWEVVMGPLKTSWLDDIKLECFQAVIGEQSGDISWASYSGATTEAARNRAMDEEEIPDETGKLYVTESGRNPVSYVGRSGFAHFVKFYGTGYAAMEKITAWYTPQGVVRRRMY